MKRENSFPWHANPLRPCQKEARGIGVGWVGRTEFGDVVGQASETCPRDKNTEVASMHTTKPRTKERTPLSNKPFIW